MLIIGLIAATLRAHQARTDANIAAERAAARILVAGSMPLTPEREQHARVAAAGGYLDATDSLPDYPGEKEWAEALSQLEELATGILQQLAQAAEAGAQDFTRKTERAQRDAPEADLRVTGNPETPASEGNPEEPSAKGAARATLSLVERDGKGRHLSAAEHRKLIREASAARRADAAKLKAKLKAQAEARTEQERQLRAERERQLAEDIAEAQAEGAGADELRAKLRAAQDEAWELARTRAESMVKPRAQLAEDIAEGQAEGQAGED